MFNKFIEKYKLIEKKDKILLAFSGGPDSVYMLEQLLSIKDEYELTLHLGYVNHNLRKDVNRDIEFVKKIAEKYNIEYSILDIYMDKFSESLARELRYEKLEDLKTKLGFNKIATGHNKSDNAETIIFRIIRGTSIDGLKGIAPRRDDIIRPILYLTKNEILSRVNNEYIIDSTNLENDYSRNKIRNLIFPIFKEINNGFIDNIVNLHNNISNVDEIKKEILDMLKSNNISLNSRKINDIYNSYFSSESKMIDLGKDYIWYKSYNDYGVKKKEEFFLEEYSYILEYGKEIKIQDFYVGYVNKILLEKNKYSEYNIYSFLYNSDDQIIVRNRKNGDKLGNKKLKKIFIDNKINRFERDQIPLVVVNDKIVLVGDKFKLVNKDTQGDRVVYIRR